ncbi:MAG TPA: hypothetical protein VGK80_02705 [Rhodanobacteraceae bacterium]
MHRRRFRRALAMIAVAAAVVAASFTVSAQQSPALDRVSVWLGGYYSSNKTTVSGQGTGTYAGIQGTLDFENDLGLKDHSADPRARLDFLIGDSQGFSFDYYQIHRNVSGDYAAAIPELGTDVGAHIDSNIDYDFGSASYKWWFGHASDVFGIGLGAAYYNVDFRVNGTAQAGDDSTDFSDSYDESAWAPMLTLGWRHAFDEHWRMYIDASGVKKNGGDLSGHIWNAALGVEWFPWQNVGFALEYAASRLHLDKNFDEGNAKLDLNSDGPAFYLRARF